MHTGNWTLFCQLIAQSCSGKLMLTGANLATPDRGTDCFQNFLNMGLKFLMWSSPLPPHFDNKLIINCYSIKKKYTKLAPLNLLGRGKRRRYDKWNVDFDKKLCFLSFLLKISGVDRFITHCQIVVLVHVAINTAVKNYNESELITNQILKQIKILKKNYDLQIQNMCKKYIVFYHSGMIIFFYIY